MTLQLSRGSALLLTVEYADALGRRIDLTGYQLALIVRNPLGVVVDQLVPLPTGRPGQAIVIQPDTGAYPPGLLRLELSAATGGVTTLQETAMLTVTS